MGRRGEDRGDRGGAAVSVILRRSATLRAPSLEGWKIARPGPLVLRGAPLEERGTHLRTADYEPNLPFNSASNSPSISTKAMTHGAFERLLQA